MSDNNHAIYLMHQEFVKNFFEQEVIPAITQSASPLQEVVNQWHDYTIYATMINRLFDYIDRNYIAQNRLQSLGKKC